MSGVDVRGVRIEFEVHGPGDGTPMLLLMGLGAQLVAWPPDLVRMLVDAGFRVIVMDNRDVGLSSKTPGPPVGDADILGGFVHRRMTHPDYLLSDMAADAAGVLDHLGVDRAHVVGVSMGGMIAQQLTIDRPDLVGSLASVMSNSGDRRHGLVSPSLAPNFIRNLRATRPRTTAGAVEAGVASFRLIAGPQFDPDEVAVMIRAALARDTSTSGTAHQLVAVNASPDRTTGLRAVRVPTLVVHGLLDRLVRPSGGIATARAVPGSRLVMFPDMGHDLPRPRRRELAAAIVHNAARAS